MEPPQVAEIQRVVGGKLREARRAAGLSQEEAAARARIDYKRWQRLEAGEVNATLRTLARCAAAVGASFWDLLRRPDE